MSVALEKRWQRARRERAVLDFDRASFRIRLIKVLCGIALGVCFWYSVPYQIPIDTSNGIQNAAAALATDYEGSASRQIAMPIIAAIAAFMLWRLPRRGRFQGKLMAVALLYVGWAIASAAWSVERATTVKRLVVFLIDCFFAGTLACTVSVMEMALLGFVATGTVTLISLYIDVFQQHIFAPFNADYRFMGVMQPNMQAINMVACLLCALTLLQQKPKWIRWIAPATGFLLVLLYLTRSRLSTIICIGLVATMAVRLAREKLLPHTRALIVVAAIAFSVPALILVIGNRGEGAAQSAFMMGRNDTENTSNLSNRAPLWAELSDSVAQRPWFGFGYEGFWTAARVDKISLDQGWAVPHAHNTYLDQMLSLGAVGAALYIGLVWGACVVAWKRHRRENTAESLLPALLIVWLALESMAESVPLDPFLPTMLAYACMVKMCLAEGSEAESDRFRGPEEILGGVPEERPEELAADMEIHWEQRTWEQRGLGEAR